MDANPGAILLPSHIAAAETIRPFLADVLLPLLDQVAAAVLAAALRWTPILLAAWLGAHLARRAAAAFRHAAWAAAVLALALMLPAAALLPRWQLALGPGDAWARARQAALSRLVDSARVDVDGEAWNAAAEAEAVPGAKLPRDRWPRRWALFWAAGVVALLLRELVQLRRARRLLRVSRVIQAGARAGVAPLLPPHVELRAAPLRVPAVVGAWRPRVLLPREWESWPRLWLAAALAHEAAHVERGDLLWQLLVRWLRPLFWFHPGVWLASRRLLAEAEAACDERAVTRGHDRLGYAEALVRIASAVRAAEPPAPALAAAGGRGALLRRVRLLLARDPATRRRPRVALLLPLVLLPLPLASGDLVPRLGVVPPPAEAGLPLERAGARGWMLRCAPADVVCANTTQQAMRLLSRWPGGGAALVARVEDGRVDGYAAVGGADGRRPAMPMAPPGSIAKVALAAAWWESGLADVELGCPPTARTAAGLTVRSTTAAPATLRAPHDVLVFSCNSAALALARELEARRGRDVLSAAMAPLMPDRRLAPFGGDPAAFLSPSFDWQAQSAGIGPLTTTPLEVARLVQAVGNGGVATTPWAAAAAGGRAQPRRLFSPGTAQRLREALADAARRGTAHQAGEVLDGSPWRLAGKTGTVANEDGSVDGWFAGLASDGDGRSRRVVVVWLRGGGPGGHEPTRLAARLTRALGS
jgi:beta-lactamase regulating signal transducer with metallopeptidase domain